MTRISLSDYLEAHNADPSPQDANGQPGRILLIGQFEEIFTALAEFYVVAIAKVLSETGASEIQLRNWLDC